MYVANTINAWFYNKYKLLLLLLLSFLLFILIKPYLGSTGSTYFCIALTTLFISI